MISPLTVTRFKVHKYMVTALDFSNYVKVKITIINYINSILNETPSDMDGEAVIPVENHLFEVQYYVEEITTEEQNIYWSFVTNILFLCFRARPDIELSVAFPKTGLNDLDLYDYKNQSRLIHYLRTTKDLPLTLEA